MDEWRNCQDGCREGGKFGWRKVRIDGWINIKFKSYLIAFCQFLT